MNPHLLEIARIEKLRHLLKKEQAIDDLLEVLNFNFQWLVRFCEKNGIKIPDKERLYYSLNRLRELIDQISPTKMEQPFRTPEDGTPYRNVHCPIFGCRKWVSKNGW